MVMNIEEAKKVMKNTQEELERIKEAREIIKLEEERLEQERLLEEKQRELEKIEAFKRKLPNKFCEPYCECIKCGKKIQLTNEGGILFIDESYRVKECPKCGTFNIDWINLNGSIAYTKLEPFVLQLKSGGTKW
jgi:hypothetical protein